MEHDNSVLGNTVLHQLLKTVPGHEFEHLTLIAVCQLDYGAIGGAQ